MFIFTYISGVLFMSRKFISLQIDALEALVEQHKGDRVTLKQIDAELSHRRIRKRNTALRNHITLLLKEIAVHKRTKSKSTSSKSTNKSAINNNTSPTKHWETPIENHDKPLVSIFERIRKKLLDLRRAWIS
ncbi:hypothetical protein CGI34_12605 [Vibrio parahaemolyticus]|nr:hypothetical protein CGI34_12605 [Vibrio parahaemolyticus]